MKKISLIIVEDDVVFAKILCHQLEKAGYLCTIPSDCTNLLEILDKGPAPDLFILDYELGWALNGLELCAHIKARMHKPVLMLTADDTELTATRCLDAGADQYVVKPYQHLELLARMRAAMRLYKAANVETEAYSDLQHDVNRRGIAYGGAHVSLTEKEAIMLDLLLGQMGNELSREDIHRAIYGASPKVYSRNVDVIVGRVRKKLNRLGSPYSIVHIRSFGYTLLRNTRDLERSFHGEP